MAPASAPWHGSCARVQVSGDHLLIEPRHSYAAAADPEEAPQAHGAACALGPAGQPHVPALLLLGGEAVVRMATRWQRQAGGHCSEAVAGPQKPRLANHMPGRSLLPGQAVHLEQRFGRLGGWKLAGRPGGACTHLAGA